MNDKQVQEFYDYYTGLGYDLNTFDKFKTFMQDDTRREKIHSFLSSEGFQLGSLDKFKYQPTAQEPTVVAKPEEVQPSRPTFEDYVKGKEEITQKQLETSNEFDPYGVPAYQGDLLSSNERLAEAQATSAPESVVEPTQQEIVQQEGLKRAVEPTVATRGGLKQERGAESALFGVDEAYKGYLDSYLTANPNLASRLESGVAPVESQRAKITEQAVYWNLGQVANDLEIMKAGQQRDILPVVYTMLDAIKNAPSDEDRMILEEKLNQMATPSEIAYGQRYMDFEKMQEDYKNVLLQFPDEAKRRKVLEDKMTKLAPNPNDNGFEKALKLGMRSQNAVRNSAIDAGVNFLRFASKMASPDNVLSGGLLNLSNAERTDKSIDAISDFADTYLKGATDTRLYVDGKFKKENLIPAVSGALADMLILLVGAKGLGGGGTGIVGSGMMQTFNPLYEEAIDEGMSTQAATRFATAGSFVQGLAETISPNLRIRGAIGDVTKKAVKELSEDFTTGKATGFLLREIGQENLQEYIQMFLEKLTRGVTNQIAGTNLETEASSEELKETLILTTAATFLLGSGRAKSGYIDQQREAAAILAPKLNKLIPILDEKIESGEITYEEAEKLISKVASYSPVPEKVQEAEKILYGQEVEEVMEAPQEPEDVAQPETAQEPVGPYPFLANKETIAGKGVQKVFIGGTTIALDAQSREAVEDDPLGDAAEAVNKLSRIFKGRTLNLRGKSATEIVDLANSYDEDTEINKFRFKERSARVTKDGEDFFGIVTDLSNRSGLTIKTADGQKITSKDYSIGEEAPKKKTTVSKEKKEPVAQPAKVTTKEPVPVQESAPFTKNEQPQKTEQESKQPVTRAEQKTKLEQKKDSLSGKRVKVGSLEGTVKVSGNIVQVELDNGKLRRIEPTPVGLAKLEKQVIADQTTTEQQTTPPTAQESQVQRRQVELPVDQPFGELQAVERKPQVGDVVEYEGEFYQVEKAQGGSLDLVTEDKKGKARGVTPGELSGVFERTGKENPFQVQDGDVINYRGKPTTVKKTESGFQLTQGDKTINLGPTFESTLNQAKARTVAAAKLATAAKAFETWEKGGKEVC